MILQHLRDDEPPERGLFFFEDRPCPAPDGSAAGMSFLVGEDGLLATCVHVIAALRLVPGERVTVYGAASELPIAVEAVVEAEGWCGPDWGSWALLPRSERSPWLSYIDSRPDILKEDLAFLRLDFDSAVCDRGRDDVEIADPKGHLLRTARVLRLGVPGYRHGAHASLKGWQVMWESHAPMLHASNASFRGAETSLHNVLRFQSREIQAGFSGSPLWDPARRRVIGMIRRGLRPMIPDVVIATDSRKIAKVRRLELQPDKQAEEVFKLIVDVNSKISPLRHFPLLRSLLPPSQAEITLSRLEFRDPLANTQGSERARYPAISLLKLRIAAMVQPSSSDAIESNAIQGCRVVVLAGSAGSGKSTLLNTLSSCLLKSGSSLVDGHRIIPLPMTARDFQTNGFSLPAILESMGKRSNWQAGDPASLAAIAELNGFEIVLLIDGLDEVAPKDRARLIGALKALRPCTPGIVGAIVATRPVDDIKLASSGMTQDGFEIYEVQHLQTSDIEQLANGWFDGEALRSRFMEWLKEVSWDRRGPTPLQIGIAATRLKVDGDFPNRPIDLVFWLIDHLLDLGHTEDGERAETCKTLRSDAHRRYSKPEALRLILQQVAYHAVVDGATSQGALLEILEKHRVSGTLNPLFPDAEDILIFLEKEATLRGGLMSVEESGGSGGWFLQWPHRTFAEALAAEHIARFTAGKPYDVWQAFQAGSRNQGQLFGLTILAKLDAMPHSQQAVDLCLVKSLERGSSDYRSTLVSMRALGAGIRMSDVVRKRCVKILITLLLLPSGTRLGNTTCRDLFAIDDLPDPVEIAKRPSLREQIIEQLHERWKWRDPRLRPGGRATLEVSEREAAMLDTLGMWADIEIPISRRAPRFEAVATVVGRRNPSREVGPINLDEQDQSTFLMVKDSEGKLIQLRLDTDAFLTEFAEIARQSGSPTSGPDVMRLYIQILMNRAGPSFV